MATVVVEELLKASATPASEKLIGLQEIGQNAVWSVSSAKAGFGVDNVCDGDATTYWQSDGMQPHIITVQLPTRCRVSAVAVCAFISLDQSYTPHQLSVRVGTSWNDMEVAVSGQMDTPQGWVVFDLRNSDGESHFVNMVQLFIESNHDQGRDSHLRCLKVFGPTPKSTPGIRMGDLR